MRSKMAYSFDDWKRSVNSFLTSRKRGYSVYQLDQQAMYDAYVAGTSPLAFASMQQLPFARPAVQAPPPPDPAIAARSRQAPAVLNDPRYMVQTAAGRACPSCGSTNVVEAGKPGTGLGYWGSIGFVAAAMVVDSLVQSAQKTVYKCNFCEQLFR